MKIAIYGSGQLARMLALAAKSMGIDVAFIADPGESTDAVGGLGPVVRVSPGDVDAGALHDALGRPDVVTIERETVNTGLLRELAAHCPVYPSPDAIERCRNRVSQKQLLGELGIGTSPWFELRRDTPVAGKNLANRVVKAAQAGYDGALQWHLDGRENLATLLPWEAVSQYLVEDRIDFLREVSLIGARGINGDIALYPKVENHHVNGVLHASIAPADALPVDQAEQAEQACVRIMQELDFVGVLCLEFFVLRDSILVNEIAPRVHNSGHWSEKGAVTSQFENHLRAILGLRLGSTEAKDFTGLINILGKNHATPPFEALEESVTLHWYNKPYKEGRKLGHMLVQHTSKKKLITKVDELRATIHG